jgi:hypothetical protein
MATLQVRRPSAVDGSPRADEARDPGGTMDVDQQEADGRLIRRVSTCVSLIAALGIAVHLIWPNLKVDLVTVALLIFGSLPWLRGIVQSISLPGGPSIDLRNDRLQIITREEKEKDAAVETVGSAADNGSPTERVQEIERQAELYENIRREMPSGAKRTHETGKIARQILSLLPLPELDVVDKLLSPRAGQRLIAYLSFVAQPYAGSGEELIETLTEREGIPYNQSWALRALNRILDVKGSSWVSPRSVALLSGMRDGLRPGSDRQLTLTNLVDRITRPTGSI